MSEEIILTISRRSDGNGRSFAERDDISSGGILFHGTWNSAMDDKANGVETVEHDGCGDCNWAGLNSCLGATGVPMIYSTHRHKHKIERG